MSILFTYGTLQRQQRNHWRLFGSKFLGRATVGGELFQFPLMDFPILWQHPNRLVHGEMYEVSRAVLDIQDEYELLYKRVKIMAYPAGGGAAGDGRPPYSCWVYEGLNGLPLWMARKLPDGRWPAKWSGGLF